MACHETKYCPRCENPFECKVGSIVLCQCTTVTLTEAERGFMSSNFNDCLCAACMKEMKAEYHQKEFQDRLEHISPLFKK